LEKGSLKLVLIMSRCHVGCRFAVGCREECFRGSLWFEPGTIVIFDLAAATEEALLWPDDPEEGINELDEEGREGSGSEEDLMEPETSSQEVGHADLAAESSGTNGSLYHQHSWETAQVCKKLNAFLMGTHPWLGKASTFYELPDCPLQMILNFSVPYQVNLDPGPDAESFTIFLPSDVNEHDQSGNVVFAPGGGPLHK
jgi:hypothetical protein